MEVEGEILMGIQGVAGSTIFSVETQTTIGHGFACPNAICAGTLPLVFCTCSSENCRKSFEWLERGGGGGGDDCWWKICSKAK